MMRKSYLMTVLAISIVGSSTLLAQNSRTLPILESNPDVRTAAIGNVSLGEIDRMYLYTNPGAFLFKGDRLSVDTSIELYDIKSEGTSGTLRQLNASIAYQLSGRHAVFGGVRHLGGLSIPDVGENLTEGKKVTTPVDYTLDLGYAYQLSDRISLFASGSFISSNQRNKAITSSFSAGASYRQGFSISGMPSLLHATLKVQDIGIPINYGDGRKYALPASVSEGVSLRITPASSHDITFAIGGRQFFLPIGAKLFVAGLGCEYTFKHLISLRAGYDLDHKGKNHLGFGVGAHFKGVKADVAYRLDNTTAVGVNTLLFGLSYSI